MIIERQTKFLGLIAAVLLLGVYFVIVKKAPEVLPTTGAGEVIAPGFAAKTSEAKQIVLSGQGGTTTLDFDGTMWRIKERNGYPASKTLVTSFLRGLGESRKVDPKTADRNFFDRLGLTERSRTIVVSDAKGTTLAEVLTGDQFYAPTGEGILTFILDPETNRAWSASDLPQLSLNPAYWLKSDVVALSELRLKKLTVTIGGDDPWSISKGNPSAPAFNLDGGYTGKPPNHDVIDKAGYAITGIYLEDVLDPTGLDLFKIGTATYATFDGLSITMTFYDHEGYVLTKLEANYDPDVLMADDTPTVLKDVPPDGAAEAAAMNQRWQGRIFQLPVETLAAILKRRADFFKPQAQ